MLGAYPWANPALRDRIRDCILDVLKDIKIRLKSSTSGKKLPVYLKNMLDGYHSRHSHKRNSGQKCQQTIEISASSFGVATDTSPGCIEISNEDNSQGEGCRKPLSNSQKCLLRKYGFEVPELPTVQDDSQRLICSRMASDPEVNINIAENEAAKKKYADEHGYPHGAEVKSNIIQTDKQPQYEAGEPQSAAKVLKQWWDYGNCSLRLLLEVEGRIIEEVAALKYGNAGFAMASCPKFGVINFETEIANSRLQHLAVAKSKAKSNARRKIIKRPSACVVQKKPHKTDVVQNDGSDDET
jgi:hypothetical protein